MPRLLNALVIVYASAVLAASGLFRVYSAPIAVKPVPFPFVHTTIQALMRIIPATQ